MTVPQHAYEVRPRNDRREFIQDRKGIVLVGKAGIGPRLVAQSSLQCINGRVASRLQTKP